MTEKIHRASPVERSERDMTATSTETAVQAGGEQLLLSDELVERARPHPFRERRCCLRPARRLGLFVGKE